MNKRIILIDDEESILKAYTLILSPPEKDVKTVALEAALYGKSPERDRGQNQAYQLTTALQGEEAYLKVKEAKENNDPFALAFLDIRMPPGWDGLRTARKIREIDKNIEIVIVTAYSDRNRNEIVEKVKTPEKLLYLKKPFDPEEIRQIALSLTRKWDLERKAEKQREYLESVLDSLKRLKTLDISSENEVLSAMLVEVLNFIGAEKGIVVRIDKDGDYVVVAKTMPSGEISEVIDKTRGRLDGIEDIVRVSNVTILRLIDQEKNLFIMALGGPTSIMDEKLKLLRLLMETSSEVLANFRKQKQYFKNERIATIGQIAAGLIHEINNPLAAIMGAADMFGYYGETLWTLLDTYSGILEHHELNLELRNSIKELMGIRSFASMRPEDRDLHRGRRLLFPYRCESWPSCRRP